MNYKLMVLRVITLSLLSNIVYIIFILAASYSLLLALNYAIINISIIEISAFKIEILHILITSVFLGVVLKIDPEPNLPIQNAIEKLDTSLSSELWVIRDHLEQVAINTQQLDDIQSSLGTIENDIGNIQR